MAIPMLKIRRPNGRLIFNMEIAIRRWDGLYIETGPNTQPHQTGQGEEPWTFFMKCAVYKDTMTSLHAIFRVTGRLCGEFTFHRWIPLTEGWQCLFDVSFVLVGTICKTNIRITGDLRLPVIWDYTMFMWRYCNGIEHLGCFLYRMMRHLPPGKLGPL